MIAGFSFTAASMAGMKLVPPPPLNSTFFTFSLSCLRSNVPWTSASG